jgi:hypothetical protein
MIATLLGGCAEFPQLDAVISEEARRADYPDLLPSATLLERRELGRLSVTDGNALLARAERLRARARILRRVVTINDDTRRRISGRLNRLGG